MRLFWALTMDLRHSSTAASSTPSSLKISRRFVGSSHRTGRRLWFMGRWSSTSRTSQSTAGPSRPTATPQETAGLSLRPMGK